ncbi:hypothetical protein [Arenimonas sp. MALMAid1274]|uniref:hypothetical protein n=1 Tax=Arenimonas sp. MALMAid1274 TaxID=3411630 RepID=UPI003B9DE7B6
MTADSDTATAAIEYSPRTRWGLLKFLGLMVGLGSLVLTPYFVVSAWRLYSGDRDGDMPMVLMIFAIAWLTLCGLAASSWSGWMAHRIFASGQYPVPGMLLPFRQRVYRGGGRMRKGRPCCVRRWPSWAWSSSPGTNWGFSRSSLASANFRTTLSSAEISATAPAVGASPENGA